MSLLSVRHLSKRFAGVAAVCDVSFEVQAGELLALIGPNGAGKSTCFNMLNGQLKPDSGQVILDGVDVVGKSPRQVWSHGVGRTFQIAATFGSMTVMENVQLALHSHRSSVFHAWQAMSHSYRQEALSLLEQVGMQDHADRPCSVLAYGDVKRVELAIALSNKPKLLLMDEPTAGMGPKERNELIALTKRLVIEQRIGALFTEHSMDVVFGYADRMIVLARGKLIAQGDPQAVRADAQVQEAYFGTGKTFTSEDLDGATA